MFQFLVPSYVNAIYRNLRVLGSLCSVCHCVYPWVTLSLDFQVIGLLLMNDPRIQQAHTYWLSVSSQPLCRQCNWVTKWILTPKCKNAIFSKTKQFRAMVSIDDLQEVVHELFKEPNIGSLKSKMAEIRHLENRHDVIFFCRGWSDLDKISETGAEWHVDCSDVVEIETRCRIPIWRTFGRIQWHVIPEPRITLQGVRIPSAILKIVLRHILFFYCSLCFDERRLSYRLQYNYYTGNAGCGAQ